VQHRSGPLYQWRKKIKADRPAQEPDVQASAFLPVDLCDGPSAPEGVELAHANRTGRAEIAFPCGVHLSMPVDLDRELMDRLIAAVRSACSLFRKERRYGWLRVRRIEARRTERRGGRSGV